ncbi:MAG: TetR/AcrR family transcriptional regulator [Candidatus Muiribacteriota bacterium]
MSTKENILKNALELFSDEGYENTGVQKIAEVCGVTKPTLYHYFGSKEGILEEIFAQKLSIFFEKLNKAAFFEKSHEEYALRSTLENVISCFFNFASHEMKFYKFYLLSAVSFNHSQLNRVSENYHKKQFEIVKQIFFEAEKLHGNMKGRASRFTVSFIGMINSYITLMYVENETLGRKDVKEACRQFMHGIFS